MAFLFAQMRGDRVMLTQGARFLGVLVLVALILAAIIIGSAAVPI